MNCPRCDVELSTQLITDVEIDECPECKGVWFENDELRRAKDATDPDLNWIDFEIWKHKDKLINIAQQGDTNKFGILDMVMIRECQFCKQAGSGSVVT